MSDEKRDPDAPPAYDHYLSPSTGVPLDTKTKTKIPDSVTTVVPRYACITIHSWDVLRFVNFTQSALEAVEGVAKLYYLNGVSWNYENDCWSLKTGARAFQSVDGTAGRILLLAILTRLSQFGYLPQTSLFANTPAYLNKDTYFFQYTTPSLPPAPLSDIEPLRQVVALSQNIPKTENGSLSRLALGEGKAKEDTLPDVRFLQAFDKSTYFSGRQFFVLTIWRSDRMAVIACPNDDVFDGITKALTTWQEGIESVIPNEWDGYKWKFKGTPWTARSAHHFKSRIMLCAILDELDQRGWECVMTTRFTRDDESRDLDTWYFASGAIAS